MSSIEKKRKHLDVLYQEFPGHKALRYRLRAHPKGIFTPSPKEFEQVAMTINKEQEILLPDYHYVKSAIVTARRAIEAGTLIESIDFRNIVQERVGVSPWADSVRIKELRTEFSKLLKTCEEMPENPGGFDQFMADYHMCVSTTWLKLVIRSQEFISTIANKIAVSYPLSSTCAYGPDADELERIFGRYDHHQDAAIHNLYTESNTTVLDSGNGLMDGARILKILTMARVKGLTQPYSCRPVVMLALDCLAAHILRVYCSVQSVPTMTWLARYGRDPEMLDYIINKAHGLGDKDSLLRNQPGHVAPSLARILLLKKDREHGHYQTIYSYCEAIPIASSWILQDTSVFRLCVEQMNKAYEDCNYYMHPLKLSACRIIAFDIHQMLRAVVFHDIKGSLDDVIKASRQLDPKRRFPEFLCALRLSRWKSELIWDNRSRIKGVEDILLEAYAKFEVIDKDSLEYDRGKFAMISYITSVWSDIVSGRSLGSAK